MMRKFMIALAVAAAACGGGGSDSSTGTTTNPPPTQTPTLDMTLSSSGLSVQQGATGTVTVSIVRGGGLTANADLTVEGLPTGVTAAFSPSSLSGTALSSTLTLTVASTAAVANSALTVRARATGVSDKTATLTLGVTAAPAPPAGSFTVAASPATVTIAPGASGSTTLNITRTGSFTGAVGLTVTGAPAGLTATLGAASVTGASTTLTLAAASTTAPGSYTLTIAGSGTGVSSSNATVTVVISQPQTSSGNVTFSFCSNNLPIWFAAQDGTGAWTRITGGANNQFSFTINSATGGVAYVTNVNGSYTTYVFLQSKDELIAQGTQQCPGGGSKTLTGTVAGLTGTDVGTIAMGGANGTASVSNPTYTLNGVPDGAQDLFASSSALTISGSTIGYQVKKFIVRRGLNIANNGTIPVLDFNAAEAFTPTSASLTVNNAGSDNIVTSTLYYTSTGSAGVIANDVSSNINRTIFGFPASKQVTGDLHGLVVSGVQLAGTSVAQIRIATTFFKDFTNKTVALGANPAAATVTTAATSPVVRLRGQTTVVSDYNKYFTFVYAQPVGSTSRGVTVAVTPAYLGGSPSTIDVTIPDLSAAAYDATWGLRTGTPIAWTVGSTGWNYNAGVAGNAALEGGTVLSGQRFGTITP